MILLAIAIQAVAATDFRLSLICRGVADRQVSHASTGLFASGRHIVAGFGASTSEAQSAEQADIEIDGAASRLRPPRDLFTWLYHPDGWLMIKDIVITPDSIDGKIQFSWALHPRLHIDRRNGTVSFDGQNGSYAGRCEVPDPTRRAF